MALCSYLKPDGTRCRSTPMKGEPWCYVHNPALAEKRLEASRRGGHLAGQGHPLVEIGDVKTLLRSLADDVVAGRVDRGNAAVAGQLLGTYLRAVTVESKLRELEDFEVRLQQLEKVAEQDNRSGSWRA